MTVEIKIRNEIETLFRELNITEHKWYLDHLLNDHNDRDLEYLSLDLENLYKILSNIKLTIQSSPKFLKNVEKIKEHLDCLQDAFFPKGNFPFDKSKLLMEFKQLIEENSNFKVKIHK